MNLSVAAAIILAKRLSFSAGVPPQHWVVCGLGYYGAHWFGLSSLQHIIYPLQVVIKSCKAVPVLVGEIILAGSRPSFAKVFSVLQLSAGAGLFMYFSDGSGKSATSDGLIVYGALLAGGALICDAIYGPYQNRICQQWKPTAWHLMFQLNFYQCMLALASFYLNTQLQDFYVFVTDHPWAVGGRLALYCASMTLGNIFIYQMQHEFGALEVAKTTTVRKLVSVAISVVMFGHALSIAQYAAIATVFGAPWVEHKLDAFLNPKKTEELAKAKSTSPSTAKRGKSPGAALRKKSPAMTRAKSARKASKKQQ